MRFKKENVLLGILLLVSVTMLGFSLSCTKHRSANPVAPVNDPTVFITSMTADPPLVDAAVDSSLITILVVDTEGSPISGQTVHFSTSMGTVDDPVITNSSGYATAIFLAGSVDGVAKITATAGDASRSVEVQIGVGTGVIVAEPASILADGVSISTVTARILDDNGAPQSDVIVYFYTTCGKITSPATSDVSGEAMATLTSGVSSRDTVVYISYGTCQARGLFPEDVLSQKSRTRDVGEEIGAAAKGVAFASVAELAKVTFRGISLALFSQEEALSADGLSSTQLMATMTETASPHAPVVGLPLTFISDMGSISPREVESDGDGQAMATLTSEQNSGLAIVRVEYRTVIVDSVMVTFRALSLTLTSDQSSLLADGQTTTQVTARLLNSEGNPVSGASVEFTTDLGSISSPHITGEDGRATATLTSSTSPGTCNIVARFGSSVSDSLPVEFSSYDISLVAEPTSIVANGTSVATVTATLQEATSGLPLPSEKIVFVTNLGTITEEVLTNSFGQAEATLTSDVFSGTATITASYGSGLNRSTTVEFLPSDVTQVSPEPDENELLADGESQTILTATVTDADGQPIENVAVSFECQTGTITPSATTNSLGQAEATFTSPPAVDDQAVSLSASVGSVVGEAAISLKGVTFSITGLEQEVLADGVSSTTVIAEIKETTSGLPLVDRTVNFRCFNDVDGDGLQDGGEVSLGQIEASGITDASGQARVNLCSEASTTDLEATIRAETGAGLVDTASFSFIGLVLEMTADPSSIVANGVSTCAITVTLRENNRGYGVPGKTVDFSTNLGEFSEQQGTTDEYGQVAIILMSSTSAGAALVSATYGNTIFQTTTVSFTAVEAAVVQVQPQADNLRADGIASTIIDVSVVDADANPIVDLPVSFQTTVGTIDSPVLTDDQGQAQTTLTSSPSGVDTVALVTVTVGSVVETVDITFRGVSLDISFLPTSLLADGISSATVTALYQEVTTGIPIIGDTIRFIGFEDLDEDGVLDGGENLLGSVTPEAITDAGGQAVVTFVSLADSIYRLVTIRAATAVDIAQSATVEVFGVQLDAIAGESSIVANGSSTTEIVATLTAQGEEGASGAIESKFIEFETNLGSLSPESGTTGATGQVHITLTSSPYPGTALITARYGSDIAKTVNVVYTASVPDSIILGADPPIIPADGVSTSEITANVIDANHNPVSDGTLVTFETSAGMITEADVTTGGVAHATLVSSTTPQQVTITAQAMLPDSGFITSSPLLLTLTPNEAVSIILSTDADTILADGSSTTTVTAEVLDVYGNPMSSGQEVTFQTSLGSITEYAYTDTQGIAEAILTAGTNTGKATISVSASQANAYTEVYFTSGQASNVVLVSVSACSIGVQGSGDNETSTLTFEVRDNTGTPLDISQQVTVDFEIVGSAAGGEFLEPISDLTDAIGRVQTTLNSGTVAKTVKVKATITSSSISSEATSIAIHGGPPDVDHFSVVPQYKNFAGWMTYGLQNAITAFVGDQYGNPVPEGTSIYFSSTGGIVEGSATTDALGQASVILLSADPLPVSTALDPSTGYTSNVSSYCDFTSPKNGDGQAIVFAQTIDRLGDPIWTSTRTVFSGHSAILNVSPTSFAVPNGGSQTFTFSVHDVNGNPMTAGTSVSVSSSVGSIVGNVDVTLPDTQSAGWTSFSFMLMDDDSGDTEPAETCVLSISVTSANNGNASAIIMGTVD